MITTLTRMIVAILALNSTVVLACSCDRLSLSEAWNDSKLFSTVVLVEVTNITPEKQFYKVIKTFRGLDNSQWMEPGGGGAGCQGFVFEGSRPIDLEDNKITLAPVLKVRDKYVLFKNDGPFTHWACSTQFRFTPNIEQKLIKPTGK